jgi:hypothetical protein
MVESLLDPKYMGGLNGSKGYRFETAYILSRMQLWLSSDLESFQQEGWSDLELFFASGARRLIQIKDHALQRRHLVEILDEFSKREQAFKYEQYVIASAALVPSIEKLNRQLGRYRNLEGHNEIERANVAKTIRETLTNLNLDAHHGLILEKLFFDSNVSTIKDSDFCNPPVRDQQTKPDSIRVRESYCQRPPSRSRYCPARWPSISCR